MTPKQIAYVEARILGVDRATAYTNAFGEQGINARDRLNAKIEDMVIERSAVQISEAVVATRKLVMDELLDNALTAKQAKPVSDKSGRFTGFLRANLTASNQALIALGKELGMFKEGEPPDLFDKLSPEQIRALKGLLEAWKAVPEHVRTNGNGAGNGAGSGNGHGNGHPAPDGADELAEESALDEAGRLTH
jgi:hypothetical protein